MRTVSLGDSELEIVLTGLIKVGALQGKIAVPYADIVSVDDYLSVPQHLMRLAGISMGPIEEGHFIAGGFWYFLSYEHPDHVVTINLKGYRIGRSSYQAIALEAEHPADMKKMIESHLHPSGAPA
jgi:hypothetical protein